MSMTETLFTLLRLVVVLAAVVGLAYLILQKGLGKLMQRNAVGKHMRIVERLALDQRKALYIVEVEERRFLIAASEHSVGLLSELQK